MTESRRAMNRLHAVAGKAGISHDQLHDWAVADKGVDSLNDLTEQQLDAMADWIDDDPDAMGAWFDQFTPAIEPMDYDDPLADDPELFSPEGWSELHAAADVIQGRTPS